MSVDNPSLGGNIPGQPITPGTSVGGIDNSGNFQYLNVIDGILTVSASGSASFTSAPSTPYRNANLTNVATAVKAVPGNLTGYHLYNSGSGNADVYLQFYDALVANVTLGTTIPKKTLWIPAGGALDNIDGNPIQFQVAITIAATGDIPGANPPANGILTNVDYT